MTDWYVMRATGVVSLILLTAVTALGIATANRWRLGRAPRFVTLALHRNLSLLAVAFLATHVVTAVLDRYAGVTLVSVVVPFVAHWKPFTVGLGTVSLDLVVAVIGSSLLRSRLSLPLWRGIHVLAYVSWPVAVWHALGTGTDASTTWLRAAAAACLAVVALALVPRLVRRNVAPKYLAGRVSA